MSRAKVAGIVFVVCGVTMAGLAAESGWLRRSPRAKQRLPARQQQDDLRNAARVVELAARTVPAAPPEPAPSSPDAGEGEPERAARKRGEVRWRVNPPSDAAPEQTVLCGGAVCAAREFCCGPPECGHCANRLTGPHCPATCP